MVMADWIVVAHGTGISILSLKDVSSNAGVVPARRRETCTTG
jgi:hypothetical protein